MFKKILLTVALVFMGGMIGANYTAQAIEDTNPDTEAITTFADHYKNEISYKAQTAVNAQEFINYLHEVAPKIIAFKYMSLWVLGNNRSKFTAEQLNEFCNTFKESLINFYGSLIYQNKDKAITLTDVKQSGKDTYTVSFNVNMNEQDITLDWHVRESKKLNTPLITDVQVNGISFLQSKRLEYNSLFNASGQNPDAFIAALKAHPLKSVAPAHH